jgi:hypothetical protein
MDAVTRRTFVQGVGLAGMAVGLGTGRSVVAAEAVAPGKAAVASGPAAVAPAGDGMDRCLRECQSCHSTCLAAVAYCLQKGGAHAEPRHIALLLSCAEMCQTSANAMLLGSEMHAAFCEACAKVCERCADSCAKLGDDARLKECEKACRACTKSCKDMAGHGHH